MRSAPRGPTAEVVLITVGGASSVAVIGAALSGPLADSGMAPFLPYALVAFGVLIALAVFQPLTVVTLAFGLLAMVRIEPAPADVVFATLMVVTIASGRVRPRIPGVIEVLMAFLAASIVLSATNAIDPGRAFWYGGVTLYLLVLAVWLTWLFSDERATRLAIYAYVAVSAASALVVVMALYGGLPSADVFLYDAHRGQGLFKDPNVYSAFLVPAAAIMLEEIGRPRLFRLGRPVIAATFVLVAGGVLVAFSRAAWLNLALACTTVIVVSAFRRGGLRIAARATSALLAAAVAGLTLLAVTGSLDFLQERSRLKSYDQDRFGAQHDAISRMTEYTIGHGPGQVEASFEVSTHSLFARAAFEQGLPGLVITVLLLSATLWYAIAFVRRDGDLHGIGSAALLGSWVGVCANSVFIDSIHWRHLYILAPLIWTGYMLTEDNRRRSQVT